VIKNAIESKRTDYRKHLQNPSEENFETYKIKLNMTKTIFCKTHKEYWERLIWRGEYDILGNRTWLRQ
jgi:hypothetical protein